MDSIVTLILKSTKEEDIKELPKRLEKLAKGLKKGGQIPVAAVSPEAHTYGYLFLLFLKVTTTDIRDHNEYVDMARALMLQGDGYQIRMGGRLFAKVCGQFRTSVTLADQAIRGIAPLSRAIATLRGTNANLLTSVHADFMYVCLKAHHYRAAIPVLDIPVFSIDPKATGIEPKEYLEFFYFGGTVCIGLKRFSQAVDFFQQGLTCPSQVLSAVQIETFKKYVLVCCLVYGEYRDLPQSTSPAVSKNVDRLCHPYMDFARAYKLGMDQVQRVVADNHKAFTSDKNYGLVKQTVQALVRRKIQRLTSTYVTLSLSDIAQQANLSSPGDAEAHVASMIEDGAIFAKINQKDGMLSFLDDPEDYNTMQMVEALDARLQAVMKLGTKLHAANKDILLDHRYISNQMQEYWGSPGERGGGGMHRGMGADDDDDFALKMAINQSRHEH